MSDFRCGNLVRKYLSFCYKSAGIFQSGVFIVHEIGNCLRYLRWGGIPIPSIGNPFGDKSG